MVVVAVVAVGFLVFAPDSSQRVESIGTRILEPVQFGLSSVVGEAQQVASVVNRVGELAHQNDEYREEIDRLNAELVRMRELELENADLRNLLGLKQRAGSPEFAPVRVIARDPSPYIQSITIDRGTEDGVRDGTPVVTWRGIVGRVSKASTTTAKVLLITDINSSITGRVQSPESRATGIIRGRAEGGLLMHLIPQEERIQTGDMVITSDLGGILPEGLVIGEIVQVRKKDVDVFQEALVEPAADMRRLERLYVLSGTFRP
ncbi:MAG: rod shape-determining protein MreC [Chloroflexota bacterium]